MSKSCCAPKVEGAEPTKNTDYLLWGSLAGVALSYGLHLIFGAQIADVPYLDTFTTSTFELFNKMSWGIAIGILLVGVLDRIPPYFVRRVMGEGGTFSGILRATFAGVLLDLCSHGILLVGLKLYKQGMSLGQTMAFLIASPWNSLSLTLILWALVGFWWTLAFLVISMVIAIVSGVIFDYLVKKKVLERNHNTLAIPKNYSAWQDFKKIFSLKHFSFASLVRLPINGIKGSGMILRWILLGLIIASAVRTFIPPEDFEILFGPTILGLFATIFIATLLEVCSEGSTPIAADILTRAGAPGNAFAFLMTGVSTDYTEMLGIKEATGSWKTAAFLPIVTVPQVLAIALILNHLS